MSNYKILRSPLKNEPDLKRFYFNLSESKPIYIFSNSHRELEDFWFDMHYEFEVGVLLSGKMKRQYLGYEMVLNPGEVWICGMWEPHGFELLETPCNVAICVIDPKYLANNNLLNKDILSPFLVDPVNRPQVSLVNRDRVIQLALKILEENDDPDWSKIFFYQLMLILCDHWKIPDGNHRNFELQYNIQQALKLVFDERRLIPTREAASVCKMSVNSFRIAFHDLMGCSFSEYALQYRIHGAIASLKNSNQTQEAIAIDWGFTDASHLHKYINSKRP